MCVGKKTAVEEKAPLVSTTPPTEPPRAPRTSHVRPPTQSPRVNGVGDETSSREDKKPTQRKTAPSAPVKTGPKEVENEATMFDTESESEDEKVKVQKPPKTTGGEVIMCTFYLYYYVDCYVGFNIAPKPVQPPQP